MTEKRKPYTIQLTPGPDDDLINAIKGITEGQRNQALKDALRVGLGIDKGNAGQVNVSELAADLQWVRQALTDMPGWLDRKLSRLSVVPGSPKADDGPRLSAEDQERLKQKMKKAAW